MRLREIWKISETLLTQAHQTLVLSGSPLSDPELQRHNTAFKEFLEHNEHELALDSLVEMTEFLKPNRAFWVDLVAAAENMGLDEQMLAFLRSQLEES